MLAEITHLIYFSKPPEVTESTGGEAGREGGRGNAEQNTQQNTLRGLERFKILPFDPWQLFPLMFTGSDIGHYSTSERTAVVTGSCQIK